MIHHLTSLSSQPFALHLARGSGMRRALNLPRSLALARALAAVIGGVVLFLAGGAAEAGERLDAVKQRGFLTCGVGANVPGFSQRDGSGAWRGFDVDIVFEHFKR